MNAISYFFAKHRVFAFLFSFFAYGVIFGVGVLYYTFNAPIWLMVLYELLVLLISFNFQSGAITKLNQNISVEYKNSCDPYVLLDFCEKVLSYKISPMVRQSLLITKSTALYQLGMFGESKEILDAVNIDRYAGIGYLVKMAYYNNLFAVCQKLGETERAEFYKEKFFKMHADLNGKKEKEKMDYLKRSIEVKWLMIGERYDEALKLADGLSEKTLLDKVFKKNTLGKIYMKLGDTEAARREFSFVAQNGNRLYIASEAKEMIEKM